MFPLRVMRNTCKFVRSYSAIDIVGAWGMELRRLRIVVLINLVIFIPPVVAFLIFTQRLRA